MNAQEIFQSVIEIVHDFLRAGESFALSFDAEESNFVRFNAGRIRQPTSVLQIKLRIDLRSGRRHAEAELTLTGTPVDDRERVRAIMDDLRGAIVHVADDPYLLIPEPQQIQRIDPDELPSAGEVVSAILDDAAGLDLVGIYATGGVFRGYADDQGSSCWFESYPFHLDFSAYLVADRASKQTYGGYRFEREELARRLGEARRDLEILARPARTLKPGKYRAYFTPAALRELFGLLGWQGFSRRAFETRSSPLLALALGEVALDERIQLMERTETGAAPGFSRGGFKKPTRVPLIANGQSVDTLTCPRSALEYKCAHNGAEDNESPSALDLAAGELARDDVLSALDDGLHIANLWYTNFSDKKSCRVTGMTRFATLWVQGGKVAAPVDVMRFDDSFYRVLGGELDALTKERDLFLDSDTYFSRKTGSARLPGALVRGFELVL